MEGGHDREFGYDADYDDRHHHPLPPLPVVPPETGHHRRNNHGGPDFAGNYVDGEREERNPLARSGYVCALCNDRLQGLEELQVHLLTTHFDDPNARSMLDL